MLRFFGAKFIKAPQTLALADFGVAHPRQVGALRHSRAGIISGRNETGGPMYRNQLGIAMSRFLFHVIAVAAIALGS